MIVRCSRRLAAGILLVLTAGWLAAAEPEIIAKARARLAPDPVLDAVTSIHYSGKLIRPDPANPGKQLTQDIEIYLQKPAQQRIVVSSPEVIEVSALDGYDAWRRTIDAKNPARWQQSQLGAEQIKQLQADVWENLSYYRGIEKKGGRVEDQGPATIDGIACQRIAFFHTPTLVYTRYFNRETGELVFTGTADNNTREQGEIIAGGIRFPKTMEITRGTGTNQVKQTIAFEKIAVNEKFPPGLFAVPLPNSVIH